MDSLMDLIVLGSLFTVMTSAFCYPVSQSYVRFLLAKFLILYTSQYDPNVHCVV
jgi:hypothetical protein